MKKLSLFFIVLLSVFIGCEKDGAKGGACFLNTNARSIVHNDVNREYVIYIPSSYDGVSPVPLMINFHGFGGSASDHMANADLNSLADSEIFILVNPQGSCLDGLSHWNSCPSGNDNKSDADDFGFVEAMIDEISAEINIDKERVYAAGYSNGGMMAYGLANFKSDLIAAVGSVSGTMLDCIGSTGHPMPVVHLHGTSDGVLPYDGSTDYSSTQDVLDHWIDFNNTDTEPTINSESNDGMTIEHHTYGQGDNNVSVEHYKYIDGNHVWFESTYQDQNASQLIWNFVSKYDINGLR